MNKTLIFLGDNYPISAGEFFVDDEMKVIAPYFEKIIVLTAAKDDGRRLNRYVPENMEVIPFSRVDLESAKWKSIWRLFTPMVLGELLFALKKLPAKFWLKAFKILYVEIHRASNLRSLMQAKLNEKHLDIHDCVFYSYWLDYKALSLAMLRKNTQSAVCVARAHRWDVFAEENKTPYLPFRKFIISNLSKTISISEAGKAAFNSYLSCDMGDKVVVSRLGKFNHRTPLLQKQNDEFVVCSCSNMISVKRIDKIIDVLSCLRGYKMCWVHFGDGPLRDELQRMANDKLRHINFEFMGVVPNAKILDYYAENYVDLFVNLSDSEGIPVSIMEALSAGIPVVATNVGGTSEAVNDDNGFLVEKETPAIEIAKIIDTYFKCDANEIVAKRQKAYEFWMENYEAGKNYEVFCRIIIDS